MSEDSETLEYSIISPVYNGENTIIELCKRINHVFEGITDSYEIILVDDRSKDGSWSVMKEIHHRDKHIKIIRLIKNFGQHNALLCGINHASGKRIITIDDDLQQPPEEIPNLIRKMDDEHYKVVIGTFRQKKHGVMRNIGSALFNKMNRWVFHLPKEYVITSFMIIDCSVLEHFPTIKSSFVFLPAYVFRLVPLDQVGAVKVTHHKRTRGSTGYGFFKLLKYSSNLLINYSSLPLLIMGAVGFIISMLSISFGMWIIIHKLLDPNYGVMGWNSLMVAITFLGGATLMAIGILGEYMRRILKEISHGHQYIIGEKHL